MADQKNAAWLNYLRSFLKQGDSCDQKRKGTEDGLDNNLSGNCFNGGGSSFGVRTPFSTDANGTPSPSRKRMRRGNR